jgi:hypothetical protein
MRISGDDRPKEGGSKQYAVGRRQYAVGSGGGLAQRFVLGERWCFFYGFF